MAPVECETKVAATPKIIWETCFAPMKWELWDPDMEEMVDVNGDGMRDGTKLIFYMKDGKEIKIKLANCIKYQSVYFSGKYGTCMPATSKIQIIPIQDSDSEKIETEIVYSFELNGCVGSCVTAIYEPMLVNGTEVGLCNIKKLSEKAQKESLKTTKEGAKGQQQRRTSSSKVKRISSSHVRKEQPPKK